jgi:hypothetical protein
MHTSKPILTPELQNHVGRLEVWQAPPFQVKTYRSLVESVARLSYKNPTQLLFYRGQDKDFQSRAGGSTLYPAIYRGDNLARREVEFRFQQLGSAARILVSRFEHHGIDGHRDVKRKKYVQWSILQHYEVVPTPLLDVTHSLRVACSFAQYASTDPSCYVYVLGLPFTSNRIAINSEDEIVNIRLLSICPPAALRPFFQEGYMVGTPDVTSEFDSKTELDFRNRLVAKFSIPRAPARFWGDDFGAIPRSALYPQADQIRVLCDGILEDVQRSRPKSASVGDFLIDWSNLEHQLLDRARQITGRNISLGRAIHELVKSEDLPSELAKELQSLRAIRNSVVHSREGVTGTNLGEVIHRLKMALKQLPDWRPTTTYQGQS